MTMTVCGNIPEDKRAKLQWEIDDHNINRLAENVTGWEDKFHLFYLNIHEVHNIIHGAYRDRFELQK